VNIYVNVGDGRGWIRLFFGFVDRVERSISTDEEGSTTTIYTVTCADFMKAFDVTQIYFNPHIADRKDFIGNFAGTKNLAGAQLRTKGVTAFGGPADIILNFAHLLMGFGSQFTAPPNYPFNRSLMEESRKWRKNWAKNNLDEEVRKSIGQDTITDWLEKLRKETTPFVGELKPIAVLLRNEGKVTSSLRFLLDTVFSKGEQEELKAAFKRGDGSADSVVERVAVGLALEKRGLSKELAVDPQIRTGLAIEETAIGPGHLLDLIDFTFVEYDAIDGSIVSAPIWTQQGSLWSLMMGYSNKDINELFMDLRPLSKNHKELGLAKGGYSREPDENTDKEKDVGVRFVPAMVMREYPFSTIESVDISKVEILGQRGKKVNFGAIFSQEPNIPGRKVIFLYPVLNDYVRIQDRKKAALKHIDVAVINVTDIITENIGRSDADLVNLMEMYSDGFMGKHMKYTLRDVQPIAIPISVARHGLRVRTYTTRFARFSKKVTGDAALDNFRTRNKILRWAMMLDHWYQHNIEYLNGTMTTRALRMF